MQRSIHICALLGLLCAPALFAQDNFSLCDINRDHAVNILDAQAMINQASGQLSPANDLSADGIVNVVDVQNELNVLRFGCQLYSTTPRFAIQNVSLLNQHWNPANIPSPGNLTSNALNGRPASVLNQAWIPADIPSPGNVRAAAGMLVSVNNTASTSGSTPGSAAVAARVIARGSSTTPVDLASVSDGDALLTGQTVRFRVFPPEEAIAGSDFMLDGAALRVHTPFEVLVTAPANGSNFELQAVIYRRDGSVWRTPAKHLLVIADAGQTVAGRAERGDRGMAGGAVGVRTNGLTAEYFRLERGMTSWSELDRQPDKHGYVTAVNLPDSTALGADPFGTSFNTNYATRFRGEILASLDGPHQFFLDAPLGARLIVDGKVTIDNPPAVFTPESQGEVELTAGWHTVEIDSFQNASHAGLQLSWRPPNAAREVVRPEALAAESGSLAVTDANGLFRVASFPLVLTPIEWHALPADTHVRVTLDGIISEERSVQQ